MLPDVSKEKTAFKHPNCGGIIMQYEQDGALVFECDSCGQYADDIGPLILRSLVIIRRSAKKAAKSNSGKTDGT